MAEKEVTVRSVIQSLRTYLYDKFPIREDLLYRCEGKLLDEGTVAQLRALVDKGKHKEAVTKCLKDMEDFYIMKTLEEFVDLLQDLSQKHPVYGEIAEEFNRVMGRSHTPTNKKLRISPDTTATSQYTEKKVEQVEDNVDSSMMSDEKKWGHKNGGCLVKEKAWDKLKSAVFYIKSVGGTGFIGTYEECTYLFTCLHCFIEDKNVKVEKNEKWLKKDSNKRILKERAMENTYWFHYMDEGEKKPPVYGKDFIDGNKDILPKVDIDLDIIAMRVVNNPCEPVLMKRTPKNIPEWKTYHVTIYGHPGGEPLTRSIGRIEEHQNDLIWYDADTMPSSSGSPVVVAYGDNDLRIVAIHGQDDPKKRLNVAFLLEPFLELF